MEGEKFGSDVLSRSTSSFPDDWLFVAATLPLLRDDDAAAALLFLDEEGADPVAS